VRLMDYRQHQRYDLQGRVAFSWTDNEGVRHKQLGLLKNISVTGVFVSTPSSPPVEARIRIRVSFRSLFAGLRLVVRAAGCIVRVEPAAEFEGCQGFAAVVAKYTLYDKQQRPSDRSISGEPPATRKLKASYF
jgi:PilZ domain-containing protein